jgi:peptidoglycan biosynthesis protein MviN/MurJ (putative lipid II flippase)
MPEDGQISDELSAQRIRQLSALRRSAYRSRSYCLIAIGVCAGGIAQIIHELILAHKAGATSLRQSLYINDP